MNEPMQDASVADAALIARAKAGEAAAFGLLYRRHMTPIYRYLRTRVGSDRDAEDLTEQVFLKAFESLETYEERGAPFAAFLYRVAYNTVVDHYRTKKSELSLEEIGELQSDAVEIEKRLVDKERVKNIVTAMYALPEHYQEVIRLRIILDLTTQEVAEWMERKPNAVRVLLHRALKALQRELGSADE
jgi:RNA polymerase sigma-70 factor (ECF subfamily)